MSEKKRFAVETVSTFAEVFIVYAENEEEAKKIAENSDYNSSKWLGQQIVRIKKCKYKDIERYKKEDKYFFDGAAQIDDEDFIVYTDLDGKVINESMSKVYVGEL
ncbi:MAG: hypothetical protein RL642_1250 [Bacteroidota bacterium]